MDIFEKTPKYTFKTRAEAETFLENLRKDAYKYEVVTVNDILARLLIRTVAEGYKYGYHKSEIKKLKVVKDDGKWQVEMPMPSKLVRTGNGYWTTENILALEKTEE